MLNNENIWDKAKDITKTKYGKNKRDGFIYWKTVASIYKSLKNKSLILKSNNNYDNMELYKGIGKDMSQKYPGGRWVTIKGHRVYIKKDGEIAEETPLRGGGNHEKEVKEANDVRRTPRKFNSRLHGTSNERAPGENEGTDKKRTRKRSRRIFINGIEVETGVNADRFHPAIIKAKKYNDHPAYVDTHSLSEYSKMECFFIDNGNAGIAVTKDKNIVSVFKNQETCKIKGVSSTLLLAAIQYGGNKLDCYDSPNHFLPNLYCKYGFIPICRLKFNREYAAPDWNYERDGEPDILFFKHCGDSADEVNIKVKLYPKFDSYKDLPYVKDYDEGLAMRDASIKKTSKRLTVKEKWALGRYLTDDFLKINKQLRTGKIDEANKKTVELLDAALQKLPPKEMTAYRSISFNPDNPKEKEKFIELHKKGAVVNYAGFTSASVNKNIYSHSDIRLIIHGKNGRDISNISEHPSEKEILFPRGCQFKILSVKKNKLGQYLIEMDEIDPFNKSNQVNNMLSIFKSARDNVGRYTHEGSRGHWLRLIKLYKKSKELGLHDGSFFAWKNHIKMWKDKDIGKLENTLSKVSNIDNSDLPQTLKDSMKECVKYAMFKSHWITTPTLAQNPEPSANRRHIELDDDGTILAGDVPRGMHGKKIQDINAWRELKGKKKAQSVIEEKLKANGIKYKLDEHKNIDINGGTSWTKDKWNRDTPKRGSINIGLNRDNTAAIVDVNYNDKDDLKEYSGHTARWDGGDKVWLIPLNKVYDVAEKFDNVSIHKDVIDKYDEITQKQQKEKEEGKKQASTYNNEAMKIIKNAGYEPTIEKTPEGKSVIKVGNGNVGIALVTSGSNEGKLSLGGNTYPYKDELDEFTTLRKVNGKWERYTDPSNFEKVIKIVKDFKISPGAQKAIEDLKNEAKVVDIKSKTDPYHMEDTNFELPKMAKREAFKTGDLYDYQKKGVNYLLNNEKAILGYSVGLGKTNISMMAAEKLMEDGKVKRAAVIVPASRKYGWRDEIEKFSKAKTVVLEPNDFKDTPKAREKLEEAKDAQFIITNYEVMRDSDKAKIVHDLAPDLVIADEGHKLKNYKSAQTKGFDNTYKDAKYEWLLTATPMPNAQPLETYTMLKHVIPDVVKSWKSFEKQFVVTETVHAHGRDIEKPVALKNMDKLRELVKKGVYIKGHNSSDVNIALPSKRDLMPEIDMTTKQAKLYNAMEKDIMYELNTLTEASWAQNAPNVMTKIKRLEEIAIDPELVTGKDEGLSPKEDWAVDYTVQHLDNPENRGLIFFCDYKLPLDKIKEGLIKEGIDPDRIAVINGTVKDEKRQEIEREFNNKSISVILATSAAEEGFNFQHGGHTLVHLDQPWVPKSIVQREGRIARQGQDNPYTVMYSPVMRKTTEYNKVGVLQSKAKKIKELLGDESDNGLRELKAVNKFSLKDIKKLFEKAS